MKKLQNVILIFNIILINNVLTIIPKQPDQLLSPQLISINKQKLITTNTTTKGRMKKSLWEIKKEKETLKFNKDIRKKTEEIIEQLPQKEREKIITKVKEAIDKIDKELPLQEAISVIEPLPIKNVIKEKIINGILQEIIKKKEKKGEIINEEQNLIPSFIQETVKQNTTQNK